ncbi:MAG: phosphatidate cytidylyltransferase [Chthoniobacterales bacterium]
MSPGIALHDPVFLRYVIIILCSLAVGGAALAVIEFGFKKHLGQVWSTYRSWLLIAPIGLVALLGGRLVTIAGIALLSIVAFAEFARASGFLRNRPIIVVGTCGIVATAAASVVSYAFFTATALAVIGIILVLPVLRNIARGELPRTALATVAFVYLGWMFQHLALFTNLPHACGLLIYVIFATEVCDIAAFTCGRLFGRHRLRSEISPAKTWEGAFGAFACAMLLPWLLRFSFPEFSTAQLIGAGVIVGIGGQLGDLSISFVKRELGTKDFGTLIPGHGGVLDRIDSLIYVAPLFMHLATHGNELR